MKRRYIAIVTCIISLSLTACTQSNNTNIVGEHTDSYSSIYVAPENTVNTQDYGNNDTGTYKVNENGSIDIDMSYLENDNSIQVSDSEKSQFELNQEVNADNTSIDTEELNDRFGLSNQISAVAVVNEITKIADRDEFNSAEIVDTSETEEDTGDTIEYIIRFDAYDYYVITYYIGEGCVSYHDDTGYLASIYGDNEEDEEWFDEE